MQPSEIISVNLWQIVVSLLNLVILFFILKIFLFKPVKRTLESRQAKIDEQFEEAQNALAEAESTKNELTERLSGAQERADEIVKEATSLAEARSEKIEQEARAEADMIIRQAKADAELERKKAQSDIKTQIVDVSSALAEKLIEREIKTEDHHKLIDDFISEIGDEANE